MFVTIPSLNSDPNIIAISKIVAISRPTISAYTSVYVDLSPTQVFPTKLSTLEVLALIKEVQMISAVDYIVKQEK